MAELPVVAAGSLLKFALQKHSFSMPVGRIEYLHLGPMDFREFADEINQYLASKLDIDLIKSDEFVAFHDDMMRLLRLYLVVGGMPECVLRYSETKSLRRSLTASKGRLFPVFWNSRPKLDGIFWATNCKIMK